MDLQASTNNDDLYMTVLRKYDDPKVVTSVRTEIPGVSVNSQMSDTESCTYNGG